MPETKLYAVHKGARPGIYYEWSECLKQVTGFKGAICESIEMFLLLRITLY